MDMKQTPATDSYLLRWKGDELTVSLTLDAPRKGRAVLRTNLGAASVRRREIIEETEQGVVPLAKAWNDVPMKEVRPGTYECTVRLGEVGVFSAKACFFPAGSRVPEWPEGRNFHVKVEPAATRRANSIYTVFVRQFGSFREVVRRLDAIMGQMGFNIIQTLPPFPVPVTYGVMGKKGCPFAATDFFSVDPACAEFDVKATPLDQFRELVDAVHARGGRLFIDLPANHTGWASALQTHHPDWFKRKPDGTFISPGAWGVTWADLVELDYAKSELRAYMAEVFLFWCRFGVDGFRCDAGYMIPEDTWTYIVARVREEHPDTVFMLEGLGGKLEVTDALLARADLDWAYSEIFQTYDRGAFEWYLPGAIERAEKYGSLVHFAETHDNDRLAKGGQVYARLRVQLAALLSHQGAWGIANGVEWYATEKIDVHDGGDLNWGASDNMVDLITRLNRILATHPAFGPKGRCRLVTRGDGNTIAVVRLCDEGSPVLVVANLDCHNPATVKWDISTFDATQVTELVSGKPMHIDPPVGVWLEPGEVLALAAGNPAAKMAALQVNSAAKMAAQNPAMIWRWPEDAHRDVVVPTGCSLRIVAPHEFRVRVVGADNVTRAAACSDGGVATLELPAYSGDGTRCDAYGFEMVVFESDGVRRSTSRVMVPPSASEARVKCMVSGAEVRADSTLKTVLSNGAGADAQVPVAWGEIRSQYDSLFSANPKIEVPGDRLVLWTRMRAWLQHDGYSREFNKDCTESFTADPAGHFATWRFRIPCGMGRIAVFDFRLSLVPGANGARLDVTRVSGGARDVRDPVRIVFRPDLEWRSFHATTKAQGAVEQAFGALGVVRAVENGFTFQPYGDDRLVFLASCGTFHEEPAWTYCVGHPEEAERGQEPCGDLFSPGWFACDFASGATTCLSADYLAKSGEAARVCPVDARERITPALPVADALTRALDLFIVRRDDVKTVIAGYPWFLDWGRDTLIFLRGAIAAGKTDDALKILVAFARFEEKGTLPNIIYGETAGNRDTVDAQLWFILAVRDLVEKVGKKVLRTDCGGRTLADVMESIAENYVKGTPNGIHVDTASGLVWAPSHFTWMDTNYPACTPRHGYPVDIQAMWIAALRFLGGKWKDLAEKAAQSLVRFFATDGRARSPSGPEGPYLCDCLDAPNGEPAADARPDPAIRPNQLFALALEALPAGEKELPAGMLAATGRLLVPGGVRSLAAGHDLYRGVYAGDEDTVRKPAYHNGTVWAWPFPLYAEALAASGTASSETALSLLASSVENINTGCLCHISEIADGDAPHTQKGCCAQAWSVSELLRVWLKLQSPAKTANG